MLTDGYVQGNTNDAWQYTNVRDRAGPNPSATDDAYLRVERLGGPIAGTKVDANGSVSAGPEVSFMTPGELLGTVSGDAPPSVSTLEEAQQSLYIKWAGIHPGSLREVLIVWSQDIVLLNRTKITRTGGAGGAIEGVGVEGRLMTIALSAPVSINGEEQAVFSFGPGSVGSYLRFNGTCPTVAEQTAQTTSGGGGSLPAPGAPDIDCDCGEPETGASGGGGGGGGGAAVLDGLLYCDSSCYNVTEAEGGTAGAGAATPPAEGEGFVINKGFNSVPVRCTYPFVLQPIFVKCNGNCEPAPVWLVCYKLFGGTSAMRTVPLAKLMDPVHDLCNWERGDVYGVMTEDAACGEEVRAEVIGITGDVVRIQGIWRGSLPGYRGQTVEIMYKANSACGQQCVNTISTQDSECWVSEDIAKPMRRTIPVTPLKTVAVTEITISVQTRLATHTLTLLTPLDPDTITTIQANELTTLTLITAIPADAKWITNIDDPLSITGVSNVLDIPNALRGDINNVVTGCAGINIQVCDGDGNLQTIFVVTSCLTAVVNQFAANTFDEQVVDVYTKIDTIAVETEIVENVMKDVVLADYDIDKYEEDVTTITAIDPEDPIPKFTVMAIDPDGEFKFLRLTTCDADGCEAGDVKFLSKPPIATGTVMYRFESVGCGPKYFCIPGGVEAPESQDDSVDPDQKIILFSPMWTETPMDGEICPCYATCDELPCDAPRATEFVEDPFFPGPVAPCTVSVKRLQRNWCKECLVE